MEYPRVFWSWQNPAISQNDVRFCGTFSSWFESSPETLFLFQNSLVGSIPSEAGKLVQLVDLNIGENSLFGSIPTELGALTDLGKNDR